SNANRVLPLEYTHSLLGRTGGLQCSDLSRQQRADLLEGSLGGQHGCGDRVLPARVGHIQELLSAHLDLGQCLDVPVANFLLYTGPAGYRNQESCGAERNPLAENESMACQECGDGGKTDTTGAEHPVEWGCYRRRQLDDMVEDEATVVAVRLGAKANGH